MKKKAVCTIMAAVLTFGAVFAIPMGAYATEEEETRASAIEQMSEGQDEKNEIEEVDDIKELHSEELFQEEMDSIDATEAIDDDNNDLHVSENISETKEELPV